MGIKIKVVGILLLLAVYKFGYSQNTIFNGFQSEYSKGEKFFEAFSYLPALNHFENALGKDSGNTLIMLRIADCYRLLNNMEEAELWYSKIINDAIAGPEEELHYAQVLLANKKYEESKKWFSKYNEHQNGALGVNKIEGINNLLELFEDSLSYPCKPVNINTSGSEFSPVLYDSGIVFVSSREPLMIKRKSARDKTNFFDLYYSKISKDGSLETPRIFDRTLNKKLHEGPATFFDNETKMIFTRNNFSTLNNRKVNRLSLFYSEKKNNKWKNVTPLPFNSSEYSVGHPTITSDGKRLFFISDMDGGYGGTDIYVSEYLNSSWSTPVNVGPAVNTEGNELFPFIYNDSILYFSSDGLGGIGGMDIYKAEMKNAQFENIKNLGYPINSSRDDFGIVFLKGGKGGYFSSNRNNGGSDDDIFSFKVVKILLEGEAISKLKNKPLKGVNITVLKKGKYEVIERQTNEDGKFTFYLDPGKEYQLSAFIENYRHVHKVISTQNFYDEDSIKLDLIFDRTNKTFIKGVVKLDTHTVVPYAKIFYQEKGSNVVDTIRADRHGEFNCEVENGVANFFLAEADGMFDTITLSSNSKKKGSVLYYLNMHMQKYKEKEVEVHVKSDSINSKAIVVVKELLTGEADTLLTDANGYCKFRATSFGKYNITSEHSGRYFYNSFTPKKFKDFKKPLIELVEQKR